jgi:hypothetical protein
MVGVLGDIEYGKGREVEGSGTSVTIQICLRGKTCTTVWFKEGDILEAYTMHLESTTIRYGAHVILCVHHDSITSMYLVFNATYTLACLYDNVRGWNLVWLQTGDRYRIV